MGIIAVLAAALSLVAATTAGAAVTPTADGGAAARAVADQIPSDLFTGSFPNYGVPDCANAADDDGDSLIDTADPHCESATDNFEDTAIGSSAPECQDQVDNDDDGQIDTADTGGCANASDADEDTAGDQLNDCETAADDDGDADGGDFGSDPDCSAALDDNEGGDEDCSDGDDDDDDGQTDMADSDCAFPYDDLEEPAVGVFSPAALGTESPIGGFPTVGNSYLALSSGAATGIERAFGGGNNNGVEDGGHGTQVHDLLTLRVDLDAPATVDCLGFDFRFLTTEDVGDQYDDSFVAELDASDFTTSNTGVVTASRNFAKDPGGNVIGVNSTPLTPLAPEIGFFDLGSPTYRATSPITPGPHPLFLSIWDDSDSSADSLALVDNLYFGNASGGACNARDLFPPQTKFGKKPKKKTFKKKVKFKFSSTEPNSTFECKLDKKKFKPCDSPTKVKAKKKGKHKFKVRAIDPTGNVDPTPAKFSWTKKVRA